MISFSFILNFNIQAVRLLPVKSLSCKTVGKKYGLSLEGFLQEHFVSGSPVIISDSMNHWPAKDRWGDMNYLKKVAGFRTVPVEVSSILCLVVLTLLEASCSFIFSFMLMRALSFIVMHQHSPFLLTLELGKIFISMI